MSNSSVCDLWLAARSPGIFCTSSHWLGWRKTNREPCLWAPGGAHSSCLFCYSTFCPQPRTPVPCETRKKLKVKQNPPIMTQLHTYMAFGLFAGSNVFMTSVNTSISAIIRLEAVWSGAPTASYPVPAPWWRPAGSHALKGLPVRAGGDRLLVTMGALSHHGQPYTMIPFLTAEAEAQPLAASPPLSMNPWEDSAPPWRKQWGLYHAADQLLIKQREIFLHVLLKQQQRSVKSGVTCVQMPTLEWLHLSKSSFKLGFVL